MTSGKSETVDAAIDDSAARPFRVRPRAEHVSMPWKNSGGTTYEVARFPADGDSFDWRVSFAEVNSAGPFSPFPGIDRVITLVTGDAMELTVGREGQEPFEHVLRPFEPFAFPGEAVVDAVPHGNTLDLNVMTARGKFTAKVSRLETGGRVSAPKSAETVLLACLDGDISITADGEQATLGFLDVLELHTAAESAGSGVGLLIRLTALAESAASVDQ